MPRVSVIIPTYNRANYISEALGSVLKQTFRDFEIIVVDDGSTDGTAELVKKYIELSVVSCRLSEKIHYIYQANKGPAAARNVGIKNAKGEFIAFLDSDDMWYPEKLQLQIEYLTKHKGIDMVFSECEWFENDKRVKVSNFRKYRPYDGFVLKEVIRNPCSITPTFLIKRTVFDSIQFNEKLKTGEDKELVIRIAQKFKIGLVDKVLVKVRRHDLNLTRTQNLMCDNNPKVMYEAYLEKLSDIFKRYSDFLEKNKKDIDAGMALLLFDYGKDMSWHGDFKNARAQFKKSLEMKFKFGTFLHLLSLYMPQFVVRKPVSEI